jgi:hypothetical protein
MTIADRVETAVRNYEKIEPTEAPKDVSPEAAATIVPDPLGFALGWLLADEIVANRYFGSGVDALPVCHPENGWDRILLTRRVSCSLCAQESADSFGTLMLTGEDAPIYVAPEGDKLPLGALLRENPDQAVEKLLEKVPQVGLLPGEHAGCWHSRAEKYPDIYHAVADAIIENPGVIALREIFVDEVQVEGTFHPIYLMTGALTKGLTYNWFAVESPDYVAFFMVDGGSTIYQTDAGNWASVAKQLKEEDREGIRRRILSWLRIEGKPDRDTID